MVDWTTVAFSIGGALVVAFLGPYFTHKFSIKYFKKKFFFKEKISLFEKIGAISWKNHLLLTTIESLNKKGVINEQNKNILRAQLKENIIEFGMLMDKAIYLSSDLRLNIGRYITLFEEYLNDKKFGDKKRTEKLRKDYSIYMKKANKIIEKEINEIK